MRFKLALISSALTLVGLLLVGYVDWRAGLGLFVALWGNNLAMYLRYGNFDE